MVRRAVVTRGHGAKRQTRWAVLNPVVDVITGGGVNFVAFLSATGLLQRPFTIVRTHLYWQIQSDQSVATEDQDCAIGLAVVSSQSSAIGASALPTPITDQGSGKWFLWDYQHSSFLFKDATGTSSTFGMQQRRVDSKAMRKVGQDEDVVLVVEAPGFSDGLTIVSAFRMLIKLH